MGANKKKQHTNLKQLSNDNDGRMVSLGRKRARKNRTRVEFSSTTSGMTVKEQNLWQIVDTLNQILHDTVTRLGGPSPKWLKTLTANNKETGEIEWRVDPYILADIALSEAIDGWEKEWTEQKLQKELGRAIYGIVFESWLLDRAAGDAFLTKLRRDDLKALDKQLIMASTNMETRRDILFKKMKHWGFEHEWTDNDFYHHGAVLYTALEECPLFTVKHDFPNDPNINKKCNFLVLTEKTEEQIFEKNMLLDDIRPAFEPMVTVPHDWDMNSIGPYELPRLAVRVPLVKGSTPEQAAYIKNAMKTGDIDGLLACVNALQRVPYLINTYVVDAVKWVMKGEKNRKLFASNLRKFPKVVQPPAMHHDREATKKMGQKERRFFFKKFFAVRRARSIAKRGASEVRRHLEQVDRLLAHGEKFYLPHFLDYRGRVYPVPDFNPHKQDYIRGMFLFADKRPIGDGEEFLKLQLANTFGLTGQGFSYRLDWVDQNETQILAAGSDFKSSFEFWSQAKEPLQFLAACKEWKDYKEVGPEFLTGLPIGQDATQSGIQIMAAAVKDATDGQKVNLRCFDENGNEPTKPFDMYQVCLIEAKNLMHTAILEKKAQLNANPITADEEKEYENYLKVLSDETADKDTKAHARDEWKRSPTSEKFSIRNDIAAAEVTLSLKDDYTRDVIKRNVMTLGYGGTQYGFANQLREDWLDQYTDRYIETGIEHPYGEDFGFHASIFLSGIHMEAIKTVVKTVENGMDFIVEVARVLAANDKQVKFVNRMGFPLFQNYVKTKPGTTQKLLGRDKETNLFKTVREREYGRPTKVINKGKVKSGASPNLVHNTDATLLYLTVLNCLDDRGITNIMAIHDSFSTTAPDVAALREAVREEFVNLFEEYNLYQDYRNSALEQLKVNPSEPDSNFDRMSQEEFNEMCIEQNIKVTDAAYQRHLNSTLPPAPEMQNTLNILEVLHSPYFFN